MKANENKPYVSLEYNILPSVYKPNPTYAFPNVDAAHLFAGNSLTEVIVCARVYSADDVLLKTYK